MKFKKKIERICKINRGVMKTQPIYLNSQILIEMLNGLYYLFNNGLELDAYIAIEAISAKADEELLCDVMLVRIDTSFTKFNFSKIRL